MEPKTIRESLDIYRRRLAEGRIPECSEQDNYPYDNHEFALKASHERIRSIFEESRKFKLHLENPSIGVPYSMDLIDPPALVIAWSPEEYAWVFKSYQPYLGKSGWTGFTMHPKSDCPKLYLDSIQILEIILDLATSNKISMFTEHRTWRKGSGEGRIRTLVSYLSE